MMAHFQATLAGLDEKHGTHTCGVTTSGTTYCWGRGGEGQLGNGVRMLQWAPVAVSGGLTFTSVSAGAAHTCGVTTSGATYRWGRGGEGQLGNGSPDEQLTPVAISGGLTSASVNAGFDYTCGVTTRAPPPTAGVGSTRASWATA